MISNVKKSLNIPKSCIGNP